MSNLILISGSISEARDPLGRFNPSEIFYTFIEQDLDDPNGITIRHEDLPMAMDGKHIEIIQDLGSGKTLKAIDILSRLVFSGGVCYANLGLIWNPNNASKQKEEWTADINSLEDLSVFNKCTILIDDIYGTIQSWNTEPAKIVSLVANERRKMQKDLIMTAQREVMIPPGLRDMATEWIVPVITIRDFTRKTPDGMGYPLELRTIHFNGAKVFKYISPPLVNLHKLFEAYNTIERSVHLGPEEEGNSNMPGWDLEEKAYKYLLSVGVQCKHLVKKTFDIVSDTHAFDVIGMDENGNGISDHKTWSKLIGASKRTNKIPYLLFEYGDPKVWCVIRIKPDLPEGQRINFSDSSIYNRIRRLDSVLIPKSPQ